MLYAFRTFSRSSCSPMRLVYRGPERDLANDLEKQMLAQSDGATELADTQKQVAGVIRSLESQLDQLTPEQYDAIKPQIEALALQASDVGQNASWLEEHKWTRRIGIGALTVVGGIGSLAAQGALRLGAMAVGAAGGSELALDAHFTRKSLDAGDEAGDQFRRELSRILDSVNTKNVDANVVTNDLEATLNDIDVNGMDMLDGSEWFGQNVKGTLRDAVRVQLSEADRGDGTSDEKGGYNQYVRLNALRLIREADWNNRAGDRGMTKADAIAVRDRIKALQSFDEWKAENQPPVAPPAAPAAEPPAAEPPPPAPEAAARSPEQMIGRLDVTTVLGKKTELLNMLAVSHPDIQSGEWPAVTKDIADTLGITISETDVQARLPNSLTHKLGEKIQMLVYGAKKDGELGRTSVRDFQEFLKTGQQIRPAEKRADIPRPAPVHVVQSTTLDTSMVHRADLRQAADAVPDRDQQLAAIEGARAAAMAAAAEAIQKDIPDGRFDNKLTGVDFADRSDVQAAFVALRDAAQLMSAGEAPDAQTGTIVRAAIGALGRRIAAGANGPDILASNTRAMENVRNQLQTHLDRLRSIVRDAQKARETIGGLPQSPVGPSAAPTLQRPLRQDKGRDA